MLAMIREALVFHLEAMLEDGEPLPDPKMSIDDAIAYHSEPILDDVLNSYLESGEPAPTLSTRFELVEIEVPAPHAPKNREHYSVATPRKVMTTPRVTAPGRNSRD